MERVSVLFDLYKVIEERKSRFVQTMTVYPENQQITRKINTSQLNIKYISNSLNLIIIFLLQVFVVKQLFSIPIYRFSSQIITSAIGRKHIKDKLDQSVLMKVWKELTTCLSGMNRICN